MSSNLPVDTAPAWSPARRAREEDFEAFYVAELPRLLALARGLAGASHAEDVAQDALLVAYRRWREVSQKERPDLWVRRVCANLAVSAFRRRVRDAKVAARLSAGRVEPVALPETSEQFWGAVRALPPRQAEAVALRFIYDMPVLEVAETMRCSEGTVKQHLSRARASLAVTLGVAEGEE